MSAHASSADRPLVSVCLITYNHERFIRQAIEGALMQEADFPIEIIVADDCSTDATGQIVRGYAQRHAGTIRVLDRPQNLGAGRNFKHALSVCRGKYIALLDGDDYWTSPAKLRREVEFLEAHPDYVACFHLASVLEEGVGAAAWIYGPRQPQQRYELADILRQNDFATCSAMLRAELIPELPDWYCDMIIGDWPLYAMLAEHGPMGCVNEVMAVYRIHAGGAWSGQDKIGRLRDRLAACVAMSAYFQRRQDAAIRPALAKTCFELARESENRGDFVQARQYAVRSARLGGLWMPEARGTLVRMLTRFYCPPLYIALRQIHRRLRHASA